MKKTTGVSAIAVVAVLTFATSLFADTRPLQTTNNLQMVRRDARVQTLEGRIHDISRERNGFVIRLDRQSVVLFAPVQTEVELISSRRTARVRDLERGDVIRASGTVDRRGSFYVDRIQLVRDVRGRHETFSGVVERIDARRGYLEVRDARSRRVIDVDVRSVSERELRNIRRGDHVVVTGDWSRNSFEAVRVELARRW